MPRDDPPRMPPARAALVFGLLRGETRLRLLRLLVRGGEAAVAALGQELGATQTPVSHDLALLRAAGLVGYRQEGHRHLYRVTDSVVLKLLRVVKPG